MSESLSEDRGLLVSTEQRELAALTRFLPGTVPLSAPDERDRLEHREDIGKHKHNGKQVYSESTVGRLLFTPDTVSRFANEHARSSN